MPQRIEERRPAITPQLAMRVAVLGGVAFVLFGIVFFRLWFLQVLSGQDYVSQARENRVRKVRIEAPRGDIVDRNGVKLVTTRVAPVVQIIPESLPKSVFDAADAYRKATAAAERTRLKAGSQLRDLETQLHDDGRRSTHAEKADLRRLRTASKTAPHVSIPPLPDDPVLHTRWRRLSRVLGVSVRQIHARVIRGLADQPYSDITIRTDVPPTQFNYLRERPEEFPGITVQKQYLRSYPHTTLAAQLFGTVGPVTADQLKRKRYRGVAQEDRVGQSGLEYSYDKYLRGKDGYSKVVVNALGNRDDQRRSSVVEPTQGQRLKLTLDYDLERAANSALQRGIAAASINSARAGAYVAMDPTDGSILALGSLPSFDANDFAKPISQKTYDYLTSQATGAPLLNRATMSGYPTGSTFKPITALASLESGVITPSTPFNDTGTYRIGTQSYQNAKGASFGTLNVSDALKVSSDLFFFDLGNKDNDRGPIIQRWARRLGLGHRTGIDLPNEIPGLVPDARWRSSGYRAYLACAKAKHVTVGSTQALFACGGIERPWTAGDNANLAVGQGDLQTTPLQLATAYATIANGGTVVRPHLGMAIEDGLGRVTETIHKAPRRKVRFDPADRGAVLDGLRRATSEPKGTSTDVFKGFPYTVYGKTGTAERGPGNPDQAWYACFVKDTSRPIVVVVTIERGGFGAETAAPVARLILSQWFHLKDRAFHAGASATL